MAKIIIFLALVTIVNSKFCFDFRRITDLGGPTKQIDFSKLVVKENTPTNHTVIGNVNVLSDVTSPFGATYTVIESKNGAITNTYIGLPIKDLCNDLSNSNALYSPILQRFGTKQCPVKKGSYNMTGVTLNEKAVQSTVTEAGLDYNVTLVFNDKSASSVEIAGASTNC